MSNVLEQQRELEAGEAQAAYTTYRELVTKAVSSDGIKLLAADAAKLKAARQSLGKSIEELDADISALVAIRQAEAEAGDVDAIAAGIAPAAAAVTEQERQLADLLAEHRQREAAQREKVEGLRGLLAAARTRHAKARDAGNRARLLRFQHARLLGIDRPERPMVIGADGAERLATPEELDAAGMPEAADRARRTKSIVHALKDRPAPLADCLLLENILRSPSVYGDLRRFELVAAPGQSDADAAKLQAIARIAAAGKLPRPVYLRSSADELPALDPSTSDWIVRRIEGIEALVNTPPRYSAGYDRRLDADSEIPNPAEFSILTHPGQTDEQRDALADRWKTAYAKQQQIRNAEPAGV